MTELADITAHTKKRPIGRLLAEVNRSLDYKHSLYNDYIAVKPLLLNPYAPALTVSSVSLMHKGLLSVVAMKGY
jgi:hypothetical protein